MQAPLSPVCPAAGSPLRLYLPAGLAHVLRYGSAARKALPPRPAPVDFLAHDELQDELDASGNAVLARKLGVTVDGFRSEPHPCLDLRAVSRSRDYWTE